MDFKTVIKNGIAMYDSLFKAVNDAGGIGSSFQPFSKLEKMTVAELFGQLATNRIRFVYDGDIEKDRCPCCKGTKYVLDSDSDFGFHKKCKNCEGEKIEAKTATVTTPPKLTNKDISDKYQLASFYFSFSYFLGAMAYWVTAQNPNKELIDLAPVLKAFGDFIRPSFENIILPQKFTYVELSNLISDDNFEKIPEIMALNKLEPDFIDLGALARNVFYMILREKITN